MTASILPVPDDALVVKEQIHLSWAIARDLVEVEKLNAWIGYASLPRSRHFATRRRTSDGVSALPLMFTPLWHKSTRPCAAICAVSNAAHKAAAWRSVPMPASRCGAIYLSFWRSPGTGSAEDDGRTDRSGRSIGRRWLEGSPLKI